MIAPRYYLPCGLLLGTACFSPSLYHLSLLFTWVFLHVSSETLQLVPFCVSSTLELFKDKAWIVYIALEFCARTETLQKSLGNSECSLAGELAILANQKSQVWFPLHLCFLTFSLFSNKYSCLMWNKKTNISHSKSVVESRKTGLSDHSSPWTWMTSARVDSSCPAVDHVPSLLATAPNRQLTCYVMSPA